MPRLSFACIVVAVAFVSSASAEEPKPIQLTLSPARLPTPGLRYQLLPDARLTISGDAAPIYQAIPELLSKTKFRGEDELFGSWMEMPLDKLPTDEIRKALAEYDEIYERLNKASCYDRCDWHLRERLRAKGIDVSLKDIAEMRETSRLLALRARLEIAEGRLDEALLTLRTGFALARHVEDTGTLISYLVGGGMATRMQIQLEQFIAQPGAPNLYYALTDLPAPLLDPRKALQSERLMWFATYPGLLDCATDLEAGNMSPTNINACMDKILPDKKLERYKEAQNILRHHDAAKKALVAAGRPSNKVEAMPHFQVALLHAALEYDAELDQYLVWHQLPYDEMSRQLTEWRKGLPDRRSDPNAPALLMGPLFTGGLDRFLLTRASLDRKVALLRTIEAIRLYAALHDGKLPPTLADIKEVPLPLDPVTGKTFTYQLDGATATLRAPPPANDPANNNSCVVYQLRLRK